MKVRIGRSLRGGSVSRRHCGRGATSLRVESILLVTVADKCKWSGPGSCGRVRGASRHARTRNRSSSSGYLAWTIIAIGIGAAVTRRPLPHHRVRVRTRRFETVTLHSSTKVGSPRDLKYALESLTVRALVRARGQGPRPLLAVLRARRGETPSFKRAARRRRGVFHCRHRAARSRNRTH